MKRCGIEGIYLGGWATSANNDFTGSTITGYCQSTAGVPASAAKYWDSAIAASNVLPAKR